MLLALAGWPTGKVLLKWFINEITETKIRAVVKFLVIKGILNFVVWNPTAMLAVQLYEHRRNM